MNLGWRLAIWMFGGLIAAAGGAWAMHSWDAATCTAASEHVARVAADGEADFWRQAFNDLAAKKAGEEAANAEAERKVLASRDAALRDYTAAKLQLDKERKARALDDLHEPCIGTGTLRLRLDEASGASDSDARGTDGPGKAIALVSARTSPSAEAACLTPDNLLTGYLNLSQYARHWGGQYDALRAWALDPQHTGAEHTDGGSR